MENNKLEIAWCYPDMLNLHGDRGNILAFQKIGKLLGLDVNIKKIETYQDKIDFANTDILFFNPGELRVIESIVRTLKCNKADLDDFIQKGKMIILIGSTGAVFAKELIRKDNTRIEGLGYLNMKCVERETVYGNDLIYRLKDNSSIKINGSQIQMMDTFLNDDIGLGTVEYGKGNNGEKDNFEGAKYNNVIFTNCVGPVFVKNPWYTEKIIKDVMQTKGIYINKTIDEKEYDIEKKSMDCIEKYIDKKKKNKKG